MNEGYSFGILVQEEGIVIRPLVINALPSVKLDLSKDKIGKKVEQKFCNHTRSRRPDELEYFYIKIGEWKLTRYSVPQDEPIVRASLVFYHS